MPIDDLDYDCSPSSYATRKKNEILRNLREKKYNLEDEVEELSTKEDRLKKQEKTEQAVNVWLEALMKKREIQNIELAATRVL